MEVLRHSRFADVHVTRRRARRWPALASVRAGVRGLIAGATGLAVMLASQPSLATTLLLGGAVLLWLMATFASEDNPADGGGPDLTPMP